MQAAEEAAERARSGLGGERPDWCIAFVTAEHAQRLPSLLSTLAASAGTPYLCGCSAAGVLAEGVEVEEGPALAVLAVVSDRVRATPFLFHDDGDLGLTAGIRIGQRLSGSRATEDLVLLWPDPHRVRPDRLLQGLDAALPGVPVAGGAASQGGGEGGTFQFCGAEAARGAVAGIRLGGQFRHQVDLTQGCRPLSEPLVVTRSHENLILEVEGQPALEVLRQRAPADMLESGGWMHQLFVGLLPDAEAGGHPGAYLIRAIVAADADTGVLAVADDIEEGQNILFALREPRSARSNLEQMVERVRSRQGDLSHRFGLYFNCLGRGRSLYGKEGVDAAILQEAFPGLPLLGFSCNAEIAPLHGANHLLTYTGVLVLVGE